GRLLEPELDLEEALGEGAVDVVHQVDEHLVGFLLVLDQRIGLPPRAVVDRVAELVEVVEVVLPLLVEHVEHDEREEAVAVALADLVAHRIEALELAPERLRRRRDGDADRGRFVGRTQIRLLEFRNLNEVVHQDVLPQQVEVPFRRLVVLGERRLDAVRDRLVDHLQRFALQLLAAFQREAAQRVDHLALLVHHVVVIEQPLAGLEVLQLDALLRSLDRPGDERVRQHLAVLGAETVHQAGDALGAEHAHQVVFERQEELRRAGIALAAGPSAELPVDAARLVPLRPDDVQPPDLHDVDLLPVRVVDLGGLGIGDAAAEFDVGAAAGHVRCDRQRARLAGAGDDLRLALVVLGVEHVVLQAAAREQLRQRLRRVDARRADEDREPELVQPPRLLDDRVVLLAPRLVDEIVPVFADHRLVRRDDGDFEFIDLEKLPLFRLGRAGHAGQLLVHAEVVLDRDRGHRLGLALDVDALLGLDRLVQPFRPAPARHRAAGELVDDQHLALLDDVVDVAFVQRVRPQQLVHDVQPFRFRGVGDLDLPPRLDLLFGRQVVIVVDPVHLLRDVRHDERFMIVGRHEVDALIGEVHRVALLVEDEQQILLDVPVLLFARRQPAIGDVLELHLLHHLLDARLLKLLEQPLVLRVPELRLVEAESAGRVVTLLEVALGLADELVRQLRLPADETGHGGVVLEVHPVVLVAYRPRDDERSPRLVDQHGVHLVDDRVLVRALDPLVERDDHVVAQIVEAELVVRAVRDVGVVRGTPLRRPRLGVIQTGDVEPEIGVEVPHPLRVAARQVRVDRDEVRALSRQRVQIEGQRRDQRLALARRHLGDLAEVKLDAAHQLDVVVHHVPVELVPGDHDRRTEEPASCLAHRGERFGEQFVEHLVELLAERAFGAAAAIRAAQLGVDPLALRGVSRAALLLFELGDARLELARALANGLAELGRLPTELLLRHVAEPRVLRVDLVDDRLNLFPVALVTAAHHGVDHSLEHSIPYRYSRSAAMYAPTESGTNPRTDLPSRTRRLISVEEMSIRRVASTRAVPGACDRSTASPVRRNTTRVASSAIRSGSRHLPNVGSTSAPMSK